ncbi:hypothetical protein ACROYT_G031580 [Oculina patagonica]
MSDKSKFTESKKEFTSGGKDLPEPIGVKLLPIHSVITDSFFSALEDKYRCQKLEQRKKNVEKVLREYPAIKKVNPSKDHPVQIPLTWPLGTYGLPETTSGCPKGKGSVWHKGTRFHDTEDGLFVRADNAWSYFYDLAGYKNKDNMEQKFCMRTKKQTTKYDLPWPKGQYCIFKKRNCPKGFGEGYIKWDDEDYLNRNRKSGTLPDGEYRRDTKIYYCCRNDGFATNAINLPTDSPFVLFKVCRSALKMKYQMKVEYGSEKFVKFYVQTDVVDGKVQGYSFSSLVDDIRRTCQSLRHLTSSTLRIRYKDEDGDFVNLNEDDTDNFQEMFARASSVDEGLYRKILLRVSELDSPFNPGEQAKRRKVQEKSTAGESEHKLDPRSLESSFVTAASSTAKHDRSPLDYVKDELVETPLCNRPGETRPGGLFCPPWWNFDLPGP